jgi:glycosyltransferase involved in cell wall biosynthesis
MMNNLITIIIPCYQQGRFLNDAVTSLQAQTYTNWEAIIVNDGSTDETALIARIICDADSRVRYLEKPNGGLSSARNSGLAIAKGEWIQFLDADDQLDSRKFKTQISFFWDHPDVDVVYSNARYFFCSSFGQFNRGPYANGPDHDWIAEAWEDPRPMLRKLIDRNILPVCSPLLRRSVIDQVGLFNEELAALEDWEYWVRCTIAGVRFQFIDSNGTDALICMHNANMTQDMSRMPFVFYQLRMSFHKLLPLGEARKANLGLLLAANSMLENAGRAIRYWRMAQTCRSCREYVCVLNSVFCDVKCRIIPFFYGC